MSTSASNEPVEALRRANPVDADALPSASLARVRARVQEESLVGSHARRPWRRQRAGPVGAGLALMAVAVVLLSNLGWLGGGPTSSPSGRPALGVCVDPYTTEGLARRSLAFDGTVTAIAGDDVTFNVNVSFRGIHGAWVTLAAPGMTGLSITPGGGPSFVVGERYLVAGESGFAWGCGYSQPYDAAVAAEWRRIFLP